MEMEVEKEPKKKNGFDKYEIESMTRTLIEAEEIKADPKKMAAVKGELDKKSKAISSIQDLRDKRRELSKELEDELDSDEEE